MRPPLIINVRGTSGSGKSTLVRNVMAEYDTRQAVKIEGRKQPLYYRLTKLNLSVPDLIVLGHYEGACGGCDTISHDDTGGGNSYDRIFGLVKELYNGGCDVLFEGLLISGDKARCSRLHQEKYPLHIVAFDLPVQFCIDSVKARRAAKGNTKEFNTANTIAKHRLLTKCAADLKTAGVPVYCPTTREDALAQVRTLLTI